MKLILIILTTLFFSTAAFSQLEGEDPNLTKKDGADWFSPGCKDCAELQTPGSANLGNQENIYYAHKKKKKGEKAGGHATGETDK